MSENKETVPTNESPRRRPAPRWLGFALLTFGVMLLALQGLANLVEPLVERRAEHIEWRIEGDMEEFELEMEEFEREMDQLAEELERALDLEETELDRAAEMAEFEAEQLEREFELEAERIEREIEREAARIEREAERFAAGHHRRVFWPFRAATACLAPLGLMLLGGYLISKNRRKATSSGEPEAGFEPLEPRGSDNRDTPPAE